MDCSPPGCLVHGDSLGKNTGGGCHVLLQMRNTQFSLVAQSCLTLCDLRDCSTPGFPVHHQLSELAQTYVHRVGDAIQPSHPLSFPTLPASVLPSIRVFSNESVLCIRWLKYCSFSFSISSSNEYWCMYSFGTSLLFHVRFQLLLLDLHTDFSGGRSGGLVFPSLDEFSTVCCDTHSQRL